MFVFYFFAMLAGIQALGLVTSRQMSANALEAQMKEDTGRAAMENAAAEMAATASQRRQLFLWQYESDEGNLRFMYDPIMSTLQKAASLTLDASLWSITQRWGDPRDEDAVRQLQSLQCGDVVIWIGNVYWDKLVDQEAPLPSVMAKRTMRVAELLGTRSLRERGVTTVYYNTEPLTAAWGSIIFPATFCDLETSPFTEYWDYSQVNMKVMLQQCSSSERTRGEKEGVRPAMRYVPPGQMDALTERRNDIIEECATSVGFLKGGRSGHRGEYMSAFNAHLGSMYPNSTGILEAGGIWDYDAYADFLKKSCVQLAVHRHDNQEGVPFEAFRAAPMLSGGALLLSEKCDPEDERAWDGIVVFAESPQDAARQAAQLLLSSSEELNALARTRAKLFEERFEPAAVWRNAHIPDDWKIAETLDAVHCFIIREVSRH